MPLKSSSRKIEYNRQYRADPDNKVRASIYDKQYRADNAERLKQYRVARKEIKEEYDKQYRADNKDHKAKYMKEYNANNRVPNMIRQIKYKYGLTEEMFINLYEGQKKICLGCDIKLVSSIFSLEEREQYDDDPNLIENVDYSVANVDHDHSYDIEERKNGLGNPDCVRGLLCPSCNIKDILNPKSTWYIYGDDTSIKETLIKNREVNRILKQWHKEENS